MRIPKSLHFIWMGKNLPRKYLRNIAFWAARNPDYVVNLWTNRAMRIAGTLAMNDDIPSFAHRIRTLDELVVPRVLEGIVVREMNGPFNNFAAASDVLRLVILFAEGGVYLDTDVVCTRGQTLRNITFAPRLGQLSSPRGFLVASGHAANHSVPQNAVMASCPQSLIVFNIALAISRNYREGFGSPDDSWGAKRVPARADDAYANRRLMTIGMSGPSVVEEVLAKLRLVDRDRVIDPLVRFPMHTLQIPCDKNWLGIGKYRSAEWP
ncbi:MAG: hypothetical protein KIS78_06115 [Labilithrix sp.]|nr:hypothetical protein [Labilithrix sp.]MCW5832012.1 hypothetical protein [Labilithrix sp.]